ncbi:YncE family protein [Pedobacter sp. PAMC26386]|nr:YncE family protein [Pedobacter sp. PAMC26386]
MKKNILFAMAITVCIGMYAPKVLAQNSKYVFDKTIQVPGNGGYDYLYLDQPNHTLYLSHGTAVNVIDLKTEKVKGIISNMKGVHGIAIVNELNRGFISDGKANAVVAFDTQTLKIIKTIPITGKGPDAIIYDSFSKKVFTFNGDSNDASVVDPTSMEQSGTVALNGAPEFAVADGKGLIYNNLEDKNSLNVIDSKTLKVTQNYALAPCGGPTGLAIDQTNQRLFTVCRQNKGLSVVDIATGKVVQTLSIGAGVDAVIYDAKNKIVLVSNGDGTTSIFKQDTPDSYSPIQTLTTQYRAKTMALDTDTHKIYFSVADFEKGTKNAIPGTFKVLVYKLQ